MCKSKIGHWETGANCQTNAECLVFAVGYKIQRECLALSNKHASVLRVAFTCVNSRLVTGKLVPIVEQTESA